MVMLFEVPPFFEGPIFLVAPKEKYPTNQVQLLLQVKCPVPCSEVTLTSGTEVGDLTTKVRVPKHSVCVFFLNEHFID